MRCREKQRKVASRLQTVNQKLAAMNKLLMEENDRLQKQPSAATTDTSCESVVTSGQHHQQQNPAVPCPQRDANNPARVTIESNMNCCRLGANGWDEAWSGFHWNHRCFAQLQWRSRPSRSRSGSRTAPAYSWDVCFHGYVVYLVRVRRGGRKRPLPKCIIYGNPKHQGITQLKF
ncbi:Homeobox-leucine zipper protein ATHB-15 [Zea mays]|uniref:Ribosomal protein L15 n=1 Tax=Zea mays TaxID=4577 RepID=A0A1D6GR79_MAIZE|nr:Homeobox-leucine zipper protein ATHB-15 [Zea mays]AQK65618.1 Homeobox-leucine zipper protein ATHB-15 [Zea mays]